MRNALLKLVALFESLEEYSWLIHMLLALIVLWLMYISSKRAGYYQYRHKELPWFWRLGQTLWYAGSLYLCAVVVFGGFDRYGWPPFAPILVAGILYMLLFSLFPLAGRWIRQYYYGRYKLKGDQ